ncbi:hypothetical protein [Sneathiella sp.]|jgi:hypothetical protein|uniref:hypothetical protein n=1 Tax=Sneathiella sp. TaxID=1964365 RepID=UPI0039E6799A
MIAAAFGLLFLWGYVGLQNAVTCERAGVSLCVMAASLQIYFALSMIVIGCFFLFLFKAYETD